MVRPLFDFGTCVRPAGFRAMHDLVTSVAERVPVFVPGPGQNEVFERLVKIGLDNSAMADAVAAVQAHPDPDALIGAAHVVLANRTAHADVIGVARAAVDSGHAPRIESVVRDLTEHRVNGNGVARRVVELIDDPSLDDVLDVTKAIRQLGTNGQDAVDTAVGLVAGGQADTYRTAASRLTTNGLTSYATAPRLAKLVDHPQLDRIVDLTPDIHALGTPVHDALDVSRRLVEAGADDAVRRAARSLAADEITGPGVTSALESMATHPQLEQVVAVARPVVGSGTTPAKALEAARDVVDSGHADRIVATLESFTARDITGAGLAQSLAAIAGRAEYDAITTLVPDLAALGTKSNVVVDIAAAAISGGHGDLVSATATKLAGQGLRSNGALATDLVTVAPRPDLDRILELLPAVREVGTSADDVLTATAAAIDTGSPGSVIDVAHQLVGAHVNKTMAVRNAVEVVDAGLTAHDVARVLQAGIPIGKTSPRASIERALELLASDLPTLERAFDDVPYKGFDEYAAVLASITDRVGRTAPIDDADALLLSRIERLARDNHGRTTGTLRDGYSRHPDYAELGRLRSTIRVREEHVHAAAPPSAGAGSLPW